MKQFLIIQTAFIGDVILATSLIEKLRNSYPESQIDFMVRKGNESLLTDHPHLRSTLIWDKKNAKYASLFSLISTIRKIKYDFVINLQRFGATGIMTGLSGSPNRIGFAKNPFAFLFTKRIEHLLEAGIHEVDRNHKLIASVTDETPEKPRLYPSQQDIESCEEFLHEPFVTISPASVWFTKQLPVNKWIELIHTLDEHMNIYLLGAQNDTAYSDQIIQGSPTSRIFNLCGKMSLLQSAVLMSKAQRNYTNDSAPMHLASAMNAPVSAIYCSTIPAFGFGPLSDDSRIIEIQEKLSCRPCGLHGKKACPEGHFNCAEKIIF